MTGHRPSHFSLHNMGDGWGCTFKDDNFDKGRVSSLTTTCGPWNETCGVDGCVAAAAAMYPRSTSYSWTGPTLTLSLARSPHSAS